MDNDAKHILAALRTSLSGAQKAAALTVYADATPATAEAREAERRGPHKVTPREKRERGRA